MENKGYTKFVDFYCNHVLEYFLVNVKGLRRMPCRKCTTVWNQIKWQSSVELPGLFRSDLCYSQFCSIHTILNSYKQVIREEKTSNNKKYNNKQENL